MNALLQVTIDVMHLGRLYVSSETLSVLIAMQCLLLWLRFQFFIRSVILLCTLTHFTPQLLLPLNPLIAVSARTECLATVHAFVLNDACHVLPVKAHSTHSHQPLALAA